MSSINQRKHARLRHHAKIRVFFPHGTENYLVNLKDFSESGLYLACQDNELPPVGSIIKVQTTEFPDAPIQTVKVVRIEPEQGFGVEFMAEFPIGGEN